MNFPDLSPLIKGVFVIVGFAIALGQYPRLETWARSQAIEAVSWKQGLPYFFAKPVSHAHGKALVRAHEKGAVQ
jgi:hypothetical protein